MSATELLDVFDRYGEHTGASLTKHVIHEQELWHGGAHIWIYNGKGEVLLQLRAPDKDIYPNTWDISAAGHVSAGETPIQTALRETQEELGLSLQPQELEFIGVTRTIQAIPTTGWTHRVFDWTYIVRKEVAISDLHLQKEELAGARWVSLVEFATDLQDVSKSAQYSPRPFYLYDLAITEMRKALQREEKQEENIPES